MQNELVTYNPQSHITSSSAAAWVNYTGATPAQYRAMRERVFKDFPGCYIVDGDDNWTAPPERAPQQFCREPQEVEIADTRRMIGLGTCGTSSGAAKTTKKTVGLGIGQPLAWYHSGTSGITRSGIVITAEQYALLCERYTAAYGCEVKDHNTVWAHPDVRL